MKTLTMTSALVASALAMSACNKAADSASAPQAPAAQKAAGSSTIEAGLPGDGKFAAAAKAAGLDKTLAGPGPYTVLVPDDAAFGKLPAGAVDTLLKPESRAELTDVLTYHILSGTMLADDIGKAIDAGHGKAQIATMGGGVLTATREGSTIVLADKTGAKARVTSADEKHSNGVVHHIDTVLMPS